MKNSGDMLSNSSKYALKAVLYLAVNSSAKHKILVKDISEPTNIPKPYLSKILQALSRHNIVSSVRGPKGGFYLSEENRSVRLMKIVQIIDGDNRLTSCMLSIHECNAEHPCPMHHLVGDTKTRFVKNLEETAVEDLVSDIEAGKSFLPL
ncbi:RrF2 family transcriptional regulator [Maribacter halichondriae]|uniref:RrF2 family transcriptional regulator n=1 Tax=Maribacter halichondriae TaxID=2980554 RepID=UPI0023584C21|nr:Rrf2 family transcriptional regulator [Maribacter sp. Hal144]